MPKMNRRAAKRDTAEPGIIAALKAVGATVQQLSDSGVPDLLVGYQHKNYLMEVKTGNADLTADEQKFLDRWNGNVWIVRNPETALSILGISAEVYPHTLNLGDAS